MGSVRRLLLVTFLVVSAWTGGGLVVDRQVEHTGQLVLGVFTAGVLAALLVPQPTKVRMQTLAVVGIATLGEIVGSLVWPLRLPAREPAGVRATGHGLVYLAGLSLATLAARVTAPSSPPVPSP